MIFTKFAIPRFKVGERTVNGRNQFWKENFTALLFPSSPYVIDSKWG